MDAFKEKLQALHERYNEITQELMSDEVASNPSLITKLGKEQAHLEAPSQAYTDLCNLDNRIAEAKELLKDDDPEVVEMAKMELEECEPEREKLLPDDLGYNRSIQDTDGDRRGWPVRSTGAASCGDRRRWERDWPCPG